MRDNLALVARPEGAYQSFMDNGLVCRTGLENETCAPVAPDQLANLGRFLGYVYFIGGDCECVKIGFAKDPHKRLRTLQVGSPVPLYLLAVVAGDTVHEKEYHQQFKASWSHGEWFRKSPKLLALINGLVRENNHARNMRGFSNA